MHENVSSLSYVIVRFVVRSSTATTELTYRFAEYLGRYVEDQVLLYINVISIRI